MSCIDSASAVPARVVSLRKRLLERFAGLVYPPNDWPFREYLRSVGVKADRQIGSYFWLPKPRTGNLLPLQLFISSCSRLPLSFDNVSQRRNSFYEQPSL
jgi:hypothetical protein